MSRAAALVTAVVLIGLAISGVLYLVDKNGYVRGITEANALAKAKVEAVERSYADLRAGAAKEQLHEYKQQVARANTAEQKLLAAQEEITALNGELSERIPHVTTVYRTAPQAEPVAIPHCVFTRGWLRDYNAALGATTGVPATGTGAAAAAAGETSHPAPGSDAELLESGVTPADILAHARDYGAWANANLAQLNGLLDVHGAQHKEPSSAY